MGYSREVFDKTQGFSKLRFGEDIDMSIRIIENGFHTRLIPDAYVYHKRRTNLRQFFKQVFNSGIARINLYKRHPQSLKLVHVAPALLTTGTIFLVILSIILSPYFLIPNLVHIVLLFFDSMIKNKSASIAFLSIVTSYVQLFGYGFGFLKAFRGRIIFGGKDEFTAFRKNFYE